MNKLKGTLPNVLTFVNMSFGIVAILFAVSDNKGVGSLIIASLLVIFAALTDRFDGTVARMLGAASELGKQLDSLSDLISFGVAPIVIAWKISMINMGIPGYLITLIFPIAGAYRLARYNITSFDNFFRGMPITLAGAFLTIDNLYNCFALMNQKFSSVHMYVTVMLILLLSYLMVSKIRIKKI